jgi:pyrroline-5-carboxylate reductase
MDIGQVLLVGCGKMGGALLDGWLARGLSPSDAIVVEPGPGAEHARATGAAVHGDAPGLPVDLAPTVTVFAVKPQNMAAVAPAYRVYAGRGSVFLSIAAGTPIAAFENFLGADTAIVRSMPNTPAAIGQGMIVACPNRHVTDVMRQACDRLLGAVGRVAWIDDETHMDGVTAVSGSGPAYVFWLIECLESAGIAVGLPAELARQLALETVAGAGALARDAAEDPATLRQNVTSPGGTTAAALEVLMAEDGLGPLVTRAVDAATKRSRALA